MERNSNIVRKKISKTICDIIQVKKFKMQCKAYNTTLQIFFALYFIIETFMDRIRYPSRTFCFLVICKYRHNVHTIPLDQIDGQQRI